MHLVPTMISALLDLTYLNFRQPDEEGSIIIPWLGMGKLRHKEIQEHAPGETASERQSWDLNPGTLAPALTPFKLCYAGSQEKGPGCMRPQAPSHLQAFLLLLSPYAHEARPSP